MRTLISILTTVIFIAASSSRADTFYIGTNTGGDSESKGIYRAEFDPETGTISGVALAAEYPRPGFLVQHPTLPVLYACGARGAVVCFHIENTGDLTRIKDMGSGGKGACHITIDASGKTLAVANYGSGNYATIALDSKGIPDKIVSLVQQEGSGPNPKRQNAPHAHGVYFNAQNNQLLVPDLGLDKVFIHAFNQEDSRLGGIVATINTKPGAGPRHLAFSPDNKHLYVINELDNTMTVVEIGGDDYKTIQTLPTLPDDFNGENTTAEVEVHANGKFVYSSNRGHDSITVYQRDPSTGKLNVIQHAPCGGEKPRHFKISPDGKWLLCGHQTSNTISVLAIDPETGKLEPPSDTVSAPSPICILFARE